MFLLQMFCKFLEPNRHFLLEFDSIVFDSFIIPTYSQKLML